jgi:uncharacterized membrane protein YedE/YeeE
MQIDWNHFTPWASLAGGLLLGLSAIGMMLLRGRILGISGILGGLLPPHKGDRAWRLAFLAGMACAPWLGQWLFTASETPRMVGSWPLLIAAGLLVGWGSRLGSGCTSGHGVCGLSSLSLRSAVATLTFMAMGFVVVYAIRHAGGLAA